MTGKTKVLGFTPAVNEASLSRAYQHVQGGNFGIISSFRASNSRSKNLAEFHKLKARLARVKLGGIILIGHWAECQDPAMPYSDCPPDRLKDVTELALMVPGISLGIISALGREFNQDGFIYCGPETGGIVTLFFGNGDQQPLGGFQPNRISRAYSELRGKPGRTFVFEYAVQSYMGAVAASTVAVERLTEAVVKNGAVRKSQAFKLYNKGEISLTQLAHAVGWRSLDYNNECDTPVYPVAEIATAYNNKAMPRHTLLALLRRAGAQEGAIDALNPRDIRDLKEWTDGERTKLFEYVWLDEEDVGYIINMGVTDRCLKDLVKTFEKRVKAGEQISAFGKELLAKKPEEMSEEDALVYAFLESVGGPGTDSISDSGAYQWNHRYDMPWDTTGAEAKSPLMHKVSPAAEARIMKNPLAASWYARYVLKRRWPEAEPSFLQAMRTLERNDAFGGLECYYLKFFPNGWAEAEEAIAANPSELVKQMHADVKKRGHDVW